MLRPPMPQACNSGTTWEAGINCGKLRLYPWTPLQPPDAGSYAIVLRRPASKALMLSDDTPPRVDATYDLREPSAVALLFEAFAVLRSVSTRRSWVVATVSRARPPSR